MKKTTYESIGNELGVSKVAVYKAMNDKKGVSDELRQKIVLRAQELNFQPTHQKPDNTLSFLYAIKKEYFLTTAEQFYTAIYYYLNEECDKNNAKISILFLDENNEAECIKNSIENTKNRISGIFIVGHLETPVLDQFKDVKTPLIFIDYFSPRHKFNYIYLDNYHLSYLATSYLIDKGHKEIGFIGNINSTSSICDRFFGYKKALCEYNLSYMFHINNNIERSGTDLLDILPQKLPTAFVCHCDGAADKLYIALKLKNLSVPNDVSVISFDNTELCKYLNPPLTSIGVSKEKYAKKSFEAMLNLLNNKRATTILNPTLVERNSVKDLTQSPIQKL